jgi:hypothetical protein
MVDADFSAAQAAEVLFRPIRACAVDRVRFLARALDVPNSRFRLSAQLGADLPPRLWRRKKCSISKLARILIAAR